MFTNFTIPSSFSLIQKGKVFLLLKEAYKDLLLQWGVEDLKTFFDKNLQNTRYLSGRTPHPCIPIRDGECIVFRQYLHGGLFRNFTRNLYLFGSRSFRELALTEEIRSCGIPTIQPIAAIHQRTLGPFYKATLLSVEIPHAKDLIQYFRELGSNPSHENLILKRQLIRSAGFLLQNFHQSGFFHGDLQLKNILVKGDQLFLIDFDRSYRKKSLSLGERTNNLLRLNRSVEKWKSHGLPINRTDRWRFFLAYAGEDVTIRRAIERVVQTYSMRRRFYRWSWALEKIVRSH